MQFPDHSPLAPEQRPALENLLGSLNAEQKLWLSGFLAGAAQSVGAPTPVAAAPVEVPLTILYGTESGNSEDLAFRTKKAADSKGFKARVFDMGDYPIKNLAKEENLLILISTWGDGDPPDRAESFHAFLLSDRAPRLEKTRFSVLALGDTSYEQFCQTGKEMDNRLEELGAQRIFPRQDCDVDFEAPYETWVAGALPALLEAAAPQSAPTVAVTAPAPAAAPPPAVEYNRRNPFLSELTERILLNGTGSAKEIYHLEFSLAGSGITYEPGDSLGVVPQNNPEVVDAILERAGISAEEPVEAGSETKPVREALLADYEITVLTSSMAKKYQALSGSAELAALLEDREKLKDWLYGRQLADLFFDFPGPALKTADFLELLRKLPPRLYSIASSLRAHPDEVHLTVGAVRYERHGLPLHGVASTFMADRLEVGDKAPVYIQKNKNFRLPEDGSTPIIMVGPGTGIAPFRAFVEERKVLGASGPSWLIFGDQHFNTDFLYQLEWQDYLKDGTLSRMNTAFSRDQKYKIYVQDRMRENAPEIYRWIQEGAHFYVCGDASRMAKDVHEALIDIVEKEGALSREDAEAHVKALQKEKRYQRDVY